jgi:hypothetical protein
MNLDRMELASSPFSPYPIVIIDGWRVAAHYAIWLYAYKLYTEMAFMGFYDV